LTLGLPRLFDYLPPSYRRDCLVVLVPRPLLVYGVPSLYKSLCSRLAFPCPLNPFGDFATVHREYWLPDPLIATVRRPVCPHRLLQSCPKLLQAALRRRSARVSNDPGVPGQVRSGQVRANLHSSTPAAGTQPPPSTTTQSPHSTYSSQLLVFHRQQFPPEHRHLAAPSTSIVEGLSPYPECRAGSYMFA
jgi:hypothetical protein